MPHCIENDTTASHRPAFVWLSTCMLLEVLNRRSIPTDDREAGEPTPNNATVQAAMNLVAEIPFHLIGNPDVSSFWGEIHLSWTVGTKQVIVMCFPDREPLIHHYQRTPNTPSQHDIEIASADSVANWLRWLRV